MSDPVSRLNAALEGRYRVRAFIRPRRSASDQDRGKAPNDSSAVVCGVAHSRRLWAIKQFRLAGGRFAPEHCTLHTPTVVEAGSGAR